MTRKYGKKFAGEYSRDVPLYMADDVADLLQDKGIYFRIDETKRFDTTMFTVAANNDWELNSAVEMAKAMTGASKEENNSILEKIL